MDQTTHEQAGDAECRSNGKEHREALLGRLGPCTRERNWKTESAKAL